MLPTRHITLALATALCAAVAHADVIELQGGDILYGKITPSESRLTSSIELEQGGRLTLPRRQIAGVTGESPAAIEYRKRAPTVPDTVEAQLALATWCRERKLIDQSRSHLRRVIQLDPEHEEARSQLGFQRHAGQWLTRDDVMAARGMIRYQGDYRTRQEIAMLKQREKWEHLQSDWKDKLGRWYRRLSDRDPDKVNEALSNFRTLRDPASAGVLAEMLLEEKDPVRQSLLIDVAAQIPTAVTGQTLAKFALEHPSEETRMICLEHLAKAQTPGLAEPFIRALRSKQNLRVNRGAAALEALRAEQAVAPLIDALVTEHKFQVGKTGGGDQYNIDGRTGAYSFGGGKAKIIKRNLKNTKVLSALVTITGENFGYDTEAWQAWLAARAKENPVDIRRDS